MKSWDAGYGSAMAATDEPRWLSPSEKEAWTGLVSLILLLPGRLEAPLQHEAGLTLFEYLTLSHVSEAPERRLRMSELAYLANGSLSRLSNVVKRFEQRGWVERSPDPGDGRYTLVALTDAGFEKVVAAAPAHVRSVLKVLDPLTAADQQALARIAAKLRVRPADLA
jgi:DNA-binding MarR family transcriptional regulator